MGQKIRNVYHLFQKQIDFNFTASFDCRFHELALRLKGYYVSSYLIDDIVIYLATGDGAHSQFLTLGLAEDVQHGYDYVIGNGVSFSLFFPPQWGAW